MNQSNNPDYSVSNIADAPESGLTIKERLKNAQKEAMDAYSLAHRQTYAQFWEQRRYEIAKEAMLGLITSTSWPAHTVAKSAVEYADALIGELKG